MTVSDGFPAAICAAPRPRFRGAKRALVCFLLVAAFGAAVWFARVPLLRGAAELWIVSDAVGPADAVAVLGGGLSTRPFAAAEYYKQGLTKKILVPDVALDPVEKLGVIPPHALLNRNALMNLGVPEAAIETFGSRVTDSYEEAVVLREWAVQKGVRSIVVPTEVFSARRIHWLLERVFANTSVRVQVPALDPRDYNWREWWRSDRGLLAFQNEVIKYAYYRYKY